VTPLLLTLLVAVCTFGGALLGLWLRSVLPPHHLNDESRDIVRISIGLIVTMTGLILGLVVSSAKSTFDTANDSVQQSATDLLTLDRALRLYGDETLEIRRSIRDTLDEVLTATWAEAESAAPPAEDVRVKVSLEQVLTKTLALRPTTDSQRWLQSQALDLITDQEQKLWRRMEPRQSTAGRPFSAVLTAWLVVIFVSFGLYAPRHATGIGTLLICSISVAAAMFLILELEHPYQGLIKVSPAPLQFALSQLGG
jgi:hypothetical protein